MQQAEEIYLGQETQGWTFAQCLSVLLSDQSKIEIMGFTHYVFVQRRKGK